MALPFSTNPMTMAENIRKLEEFDGSIPVDKIPKDYSTDEQDTGLKWVDGKEIYRKSWSGVSPTEGFTQINVGVVDKIISIRGTHGQSNNRYYDFGYDFRSSYYEKTVGVFYLIASTNESFQNVPIELIFEYTKPALTSASPDRELTASTEADAAPEPEAEPELKKATKKKTTTKKEEEE